jgi:endonuclease YncB( thermonuclease family)
LFQFPCCTLYRANEHRRLFEHGRTPGTRDVVGQIVTVCVRDIDRYKRTVAEIILPDDRNLNQELVRAGLAWWYQHYARRELMLRDLEQEARAAKRGLWADQEALAPWEWRRIRVARLAIYIERL